MIKDFLFFSYSWVKNANIIFKQFELNGYVCDFVDETNLHTFKPIHQYKNIVLYLHENNTIPITNYLIDTFYKYSNLIQHDDTDEEHVQVWSNKTPNLVIQRELTQNSKNIHKCIVEPMHFAVESIYEDMDKKYDVSFVATLTNNRRINFVNKILDLSKNELKHLKWFIEVSPRDTRTPTKFKEIINSSKIGLHYYGNSYDSLRIWEMASCKTAILMPKMKTLSVQKEYMEFTEYETFEEDFSDLKDKILKLLNNDTYKILANNSYKAFNLRHNHVKCYDYYHGILKKHNLI